MCEPTTPINATSAGRAAAGVTAKMCLDREMAEKMRLEHYEPFIKLVRMHLLSFESFELDLNTDDKEHQGEKTKKRKFNFHKKAKGCAYTKTNSPGEQVGQALTPEGIAQIKQLSEFLLEEKNIIQEGIFRRTGAVSRQNELKSIVTSFAPLNLNAGGYTVHDCASVLKNFLAELPEPLLTDLYYPAHCQIADLCNINDESTQSSREKRLLHILQLLLLLLPDENRYLLQILIEMLNKTMTHESSNKMSADSLATLFTPHLICPRKLSPEQLHAISQQMSSVVSFMITKGDIIFDIPPKLATDVRAFSVEQKRKKELVEKQQLLDESVSDSTVNTVYTFVDQVKTAEENNSNPTDTALAQLYAHIQTLPESSRKRKLIKKFNKENGQGTPLQTVMLNRLKSNGSNTTTPIGFKSIIGDSIKKRIFHKGLMSKTPKRVQTPSSASSSSKQSKQSHSASSAGFETPVRPSSSAGPSSNCLKTRVLFTSPVVKPSPPSTPNLKSTSTTSLQSIAEDNSIKSPEPIQKSITPIATTEKKTVAFADDIYKQHDDNDDSTFESSLEVNAFSDSSNSSFSASGMKSLYKSEPNLLSNLMCDKAKDNIKTQAQSAQHKQQQSTLGGGFQKIIKGVSMANLKLCPFSSERSKTLAKSASVMVRRRASFKEFVDFKENYDSFMETPKKNFPIGWDLLPDGRLGLGRRSMSPITKSTQRMPKSMQESIMTPRSRKPVMLLGLTMINSSDPNNHTQLNQSGFTSLPEEDEEEEDSLGNTSMYRSRSEGDLQTSLHNEAHQLNTATTVVSNSEDVSGKEQRSTSAPDSLVSEAFSRTGFSPSPVDSSFSSHPDDFGSTADIRDLSESEMSESLLYCLNGNQPPMDLSNVSAVSTTEGDPSDRRFPAIGRKRASVALEDELKNCDVAVKTKKLVLLNQEQDNECKAVPGETSL